MNLITEFDQVTESGSVASLCRSITFLIQTGAADCTINKFPLVANQPFTINCEPGEMDVTNYNAVFSGANPKLLHVFRQFEVK